MLLFTTSVLLRTGGAGQPCQTLAWSLESRSPRTGHRRLARVRWLWTLAAQLNQLQAPSRKTPVHFDSCTATDAQRYSPDHESLQCEMRSDRTARCGASTRKHYQHSWSDEPGRPQRSDDTPEPKLASLVFGSGQRLETQPLASGTPSLQIQLAPAVPHVI